MTTKKSNHSQERTGEEGRVGYRGLRQTSDSPDTQPNLIESKAKLELISEIESKMLTLSTYDFARWMIEFIEIEKLKLQNANTTNP